MVVAFGGLQAQATSPSAAARRAEILMRDLVARQLFQGAVVLSHGDSVMYAAGFGFADRERRVRFTPETPTDAASMAKTFTAAALLGLAGEGRVDLEATVQSIVPAYPHPQTRVRHLLAHSAGLPDYEWLDGRVTPGAVRTNDSHLALIAREAPTPSFPPGTAYAYDNVAYDVAAMVVEQIAGTSFAEVLASRLTGPLGITAFLRPARFADWTGVRTRGYRRTAAGWEPHDAFDLEGFYGASNVYLSARALNRWVARYRELMPDEIRRAAVRPARLDDGRTTGISMGSWYTSPDGNQRYYTGDLNGFYSVGYADDARGISVAWVANDAPPPWLQPALTRALIAIVEGRTPELLRAPRRATAAADPSGTYPVAGLGEVTVRREETRLLVRVREVDYEAYPISPEVRYLPGMDAYLRFTVGRNGGVTLSWDSVFQVAQSVERTAKPRR